MRNWLPVRLHATSTPDQNKFKSPAWGRQASAVKGHWHEALRRWCEPWFTQHRSLECVSRSRASLRQLERPSPYLVILRGGVCRSETQTTPRRMCLTDELPSPRLVEECCLLRAADPKLSVRPELKPSRPGGTWSHYHPLA